MKLTIGCLHVMSHSHKFCVAKSEKIGKSMRSIYFCSTTSWKTICSLTMDTCFHLHGTQLCETHCTCQALMNFLHPWILSSTAPSFNHFNMAVQYFRTERKSYCTSIDIKVVHIIVIMHSSTDKNKCALSTHTSCTIMSSLLLLRSTEENWLY